MYTSPWGLFKLWGDGVSTLDIEHSGPRIRSLLLLLFYLSAPKKFYRFIDHSFRFPPPPDLSHITPHLPNADAASIYLCTRFFTPLSRPAAERPSSCLFVFLWVGWSWFGPLWCCSVFPKFLLTMGSIIEWEGVMSISAIYRIQTFLQFLGWRWGIVVGFAADVQTLYNIVQRESCTFGDIKILIFPWCICLWECLFFLFDIAIGKVHFLL